MPEPCHHKGLFPRVARTGSTRHSRLHDPAKRPEPPICSTQNRPASTCLRLFLNHPKQTASYPLALCFERETSHNQVLTQHASCMLTSSQQPQIHTSSNHKTATRRHSRSHSHPHLQAVAGSRRQAHRHSQARFFDPQAHSQAVTGTFLTLAPTII